MKLINTLAIAATLLVSSCAVAPVMAEDCPAGRSFTEIETAVKDAGAPPLVRLTQEQKDALVKHKGNPPLVGDWEPVLTANVGGDLEAILIFQEDCLKGVMGPAPTPVVNAILDPNFDDGGI